MKSLNYVAVVAVMVLALGTVAQAADVTLFFADFETDQSTTFTVQNGAGDFVANFTYAYDTYTTQAGTTGPTSIPQSPSSPGAGTKALRMEANNNDLTEGADAVTVFPIPAAGLSNYTMTFDLWLQYNGPAAGGTGSTEFIVVGGHSDAASAAWPDATAFNGFFWTITGEGGAAQDSRYYQGTGAAPVRDDTIPNWFGANALNNLDAAWQAFFVPPTYETLGSPGKAWTQVEMVVNGSSVAVSLTPDGGTKTQVASFTASGAPTSGTPFVGYMDIFTSIATPPQDNFGLVDNLQILVPAPSTGAQNWSLYE
ncbi:MAG: hypothetical protein V2A74_15420 [bacterium]